MAVLMGFTALVIDMGLFFEDRRHLQNSADAAALAGVAELPQNPNKAIAVAKTWATNNGVDAGNVKKVEVRTTHFPNDTLYVEMSQQFDWIFARAIGKTHSNVGAQAAAVIGNQRLGHAKQRF